MSQCMKNTMADNTSEDAIANASPEMQKQWITAKQSQIRLTHKTKLAPIDCDVIDYISTQSMLRIDDKLADYKNATCSISGGSDSDVVLDMLARAYSGFKDVRFVFFDTGVEYDATKKHLDDLEKKYGVRIERERERLNQFLHVVRSLDNHFYPSSSARISKGCNIMDSNGKMNPTRSYRSVIR